MAVLHADALGVLVPVLNAALVDTVHTRIPSSRPAKFFLLRRTGGTARDVVIDDAQITVESWASSEQDAADMAQLIRQALHTLGETGAGRVRGVREFSGPAYLPDPDSAQHRYSQTFSVSLRVAA